jgi:hypothetical protein
MLTNGTLGLLGSRSPSDDSYDLKFSSGFIYADIGNGSSWIVTAAKVAYPYTAGNWYHIASVVTQTNYIFYVNGTAVGGGSYANSTPLLFNATHQIKIGYTGTGSEYMNGRIDEVSIYNRALSPAEITANFDAGSAGMCSPVPYFNTSANAVKWVTNGFSMQIAGLTAHGNVLLYSSTNLISWKPIYTNPPVFGTLQFIDTNATKFPRLFYRVLQQ